jgi:hypothetical protein
MTFKELTGGKRSSSLHTVSGKKIKKLKLQNIIFDGTLTVRKFSLFAGEQGLQTLSPRKARDDYTHSSQSTPVTDMLRVPHYRCVGEVAAASRRS